MHFFLRRTAFSLLTTAFALALTPAAAHAQIKDRLKNGSLAIGGTGQFSKILEENPTPYTANGYTYNNQQQYTNETPGFLASYQFNPVRWAGVELNYGYNHYHEIYSYNYALNSPNINTPVNTAARSITTDSHELTGAYIVLAKRIPLQPYFGVGGGAIDFLPSGGGFHQWRGAGLLETGIDFAVPQTAHHLSFRVGGRSLYYRAPNYGAPFLSTRSWRVTAEPSLAAVYRF